MHLKFRERPDFLSYISTLHFLRLNRNPPPIRESILHMYFIFRSKTYNYFIIFLTSYGIAAAYTEVDKIMKNK